MDTLLLIVLCTAGYIVAYNTYGRFLAKKIFKLDKNAPVPSLTLSDGIDYVPARKPVIFGHHFTSIAGTGPIVGPAIGIIWGWLPAVLWVFLGSILMGAVHDFGTLVVSMRNEGKSISEVAAKYINRRVRFIFFVIVFLALWIVIAIFGVIIAVVFQIYPESVLPVWLEIPIAVALGWAVYKKGANLALATLMAVATMYLTVSLGAYLEIRWPGLLSMPEGTFLPPTGLWTIVLLLYAWIASTLPVNMLLQPRDYINAWQLFIAMGLLTCGVVVASATGNLPLVAPAVNLSPAQAPPIWPFMFVVIACGAISGFHSLVASGTSSKQISSESHSLFVGYGSMLMESALAVLVIVCVAAGIGMGQETLEAGQAVWQQYYSSWAGEKGLATKIAPVVGGAANIMTSISLPKSIGIAVMGVFIASFAGTTLDTSVRIQRYVIGELTTELRMPYLSNRWVATSLAVGSAAVLAFATGANGMGAMKLWPLFGTANQLLAALALLVVTMYLRSRGRAAFIVTAVPCLIMLTITSSAMILSEKRFIASQNWLLTTIGAGISILALWMIIETVILFFKSPAATADSGGSAVSA